MVVTGTASLPRCLWFLWPRTHAGLLGGRVASASAWAATCSLPVRRPRTLGRAQRRQPRHPHRRPREDSSVDWGVTEQRREEPAASDAGVAGAFSN